MGFKNHKLWSLFLPYLTPLNLFSNREDSKNALKISYLVHFLILTNFEIVHFSIFVPATQKPYQNSARWHWEPRGLREDFLWCFCGAFLKYHIFTDFCRKL